MNVARWEQIRALYLAASERGRDDRETWLRARAGDDEELVAEVLRLLRSEPDDSRFIEPPDPAAILEAAEARLGALAGRRLGDFVLGEEIGRGGMGVVYAATQEPLGRRVAVKVLSPAVSASTTALERFRREARAASRLRHPSVAQVLAFGESDGLVYYAMERVDGQSLERMLRASRDGAPASAPLDLREVRTCARVVERIARALHYAHAHQLIHRDVKPHNILVDERGAPYLVDFGLAKDAELETISGTGEVAGTPHYMSPEQAQTRGIRLDHRTDVYSLGAVLYELLTRRRPFEGGTSQQILHDVVVREPRPVRALVPDVPAPLATICGKAMRKRREDRYPTAEAMADDLRRFLDGEGVLARPPSPLVRTWDHLQQRRALLVALPATALGVWAGLLVRDRVASARSRARVDVVLAPGLGEASVTTQAFGPAPHERGSLRAHGETRRGRLSFAADPGMTRIGVRTRDGASAELDRMLGEGEALVLEARPRREADVTDAMARIPGGTLALRQEYFDDPRTGQRVAYDHDVEVDPFWLDRATVTNAEYEHFVDETGWVSEGWWNGAAEYADIPLERWQSLPVTGVTWLDATSYAEWRGKRLPTMSEHVFAAVGPDRRWLRALLESEARDALVVGREMRVSWQGLDGSSLGAYATLAEPSRSGPPAPPHGLHHLMGNVAEWVSSPPIEPAEKGTWVVRHDDRHTLGGAWHWPRARIEDGPLAGSPSMDARQPGFDIGFRCARSMTS